MNLEETIEKVNANYKQNKIKGHNATLNRLLGGGYDKGRIVTVCGKDAEKFVSREIITIGKPTVLNAYDTEYSVLVIDQQWTTWQGYRFIINKYDVVFVVCETPTDICMLYSDLVMKVENGTVEFWKSRYFDPDSVKLNIKCF